MIDCVRYVTGVAYDDY